MAAHSMPVCALVDTVAPFKEKKKASASRSFLTEQTLSPENLYIQTSLIWMSEEAEVRLSGLKQLYPKAAERESSLTLQLNPAHPSSPSAHPQLTHRGDIAALLTPWNGNGTW